MVSRLRTWGDGCVKSSTTMTSAWRVYWICSKSALNTALSSHARCSPTAAWITTKSCVWLWLKFWRTWNICATQGRYNSSSPITGSFSTLSSKTILKMERRRTAELSGARSIFKIVLVEFFVVNCARNRVEELEHTRVDREKGDRAGQSIAQETLNAVIIDVELVAEREDVLLDHTGCTIQYQYIISIRAGMLLQTERAIQERANQDL